MQQANQAWIAMFRRIPANLQDTLALGLTTGAEIVVQKIIKLEPDFMLIRGRLSGTQDNGRIVLIPYGQLTFVALTRILKDQEVESIFGKGAPPAAADIPLTPVTEEGEAQPGGTTLETVLPDDVDEDDKKSTPKKPEPVSKSALIAKLRERMKETK